MKIGLFIKYEVVDRNFEASFIKKLSSLGFTFDNKNPDIVITFGGDGTFLKAVQKYINEIDKVKFLCINKGKLGYFSDYKFDELDEALANINELVPHSYRLLRASIGKEEIYAVNEIRIENPFHTLKSEVFIDDEYLESFRGNGLIVSTSLGSTAYNKSLGGAVVEPASETMQLTEIAPINNRLYESFGSSLVLSKERTITFKGEFSSVLVGYDYLVKNSINSDEIKIQLSAKKATILNKKDRNYIKRISETFIRK